ncbi:hypothetical protein EGH25_01830 [Haladaptatus sp. F3-133]|uniref:DUF7967 domain-containing protein n=1 Tax=Halorutilus salinus TaxID=2487751 RepID=A0A9Q4C432_9EURY|nr:hypothetical protein [Halorutilus salinus]MCX2818094.1 hypothetical protein [Halorutilus salinus]
MTDDETRVWLVERAYSEEVQNMLELVYATPDGSRHLHLQKMLSSPYQADSITAARDAPDEKLEPVRDGETEERYAREAERMSEKYEADETV